MKRLIAPFMFLFATAMVLTACHTTPGTGSGPQSVSAGGETRVRVQQYR